MNGFFSKVMVAGLVGGGLYLTGDLEWMMDRTGSWARGETAATPDSSAVSATDTPPVTNGLPTTQPIASPGMPAVADTRTTPGGSSGGPLPVGGVPLPELSHEQVHVPSLRAGDRILARSTYEVVAFDLIEPRSGEAVEHRHAILSPGIVTAAALTTPRRVVLPAMLALGQPLTFPSVNGSQASTLPPVGGIEALGIERPVE
ncbi:MAG: hypothetical protein ACO3NZ_03110 [Pirellulales bacterium]|jgi:hypothetical protein